MDTENDRTVDSVFGQTPAFSLNDPQVNPAVVQYLSGVRQEALRTSVIRTARVKRHTADIYDDDEVLIKRPRAQMPSSEAVKYVESHLNEIIRWFKDARKMVLGNSIILQSHTDDSINLLLHFLREYLTGMSEKDGEAADLLSILEDLPPMEENEDYELDEEWAESVVKKLCTRNIRSVNDIKLIINDSNLPKPIGFKQWYRYLQQTEPSQFAFSSTIDERNIWVLVQYMAQEWIKTMSKCKKPAQSAKFSSWLLYVLFNVPNRLTAEYTSNLRNLGKKCRRAVRETPENGNEGQNEPRSLLIKDVLSRELAELNVPEPPAGLNITQLSLSVIAVIYGQKDLIDWTISDDQL